MRTFRLKGYVEVLFTVEVDAETESEAFEQAYEYIEQEKLDAIEFEKFQHLQLFDENGR